MISLPVKAILWKEYREQRALAAVVIGGTSLMGGEGRLSGTLIGAFIISYGLGAEMLNFGALIAFMGVNLSIGIRKAARRRTAVARPNRERYAKSQANPGDSARVK